MIYPIVAYGSPVLKKCAADLSLDPKIIEPLVANMYETMYHAKGVGLAAPQIGMSIRLFLIDSTKLNSDDERKDREEEGIKEAFINAKILTYSEETISMEEGCLSIPGVYGMVERPKKIRIQYFDSKLVLQEKDFSGFTARVIQHEYDHIEGELFTDKLKPLKKQMIKRKLDDIKKGLISSRYKMKFNQV